VLQLVRLVDEGEAGVDDVVAREALALEVHAEPVPVVRRVSEMESAHGIAVEAAATEVSAPGAGLRRLDQQLLVEPDGTLDRFDEPCPAATVFLHRSVVVAKRDPGARRESFHRVDEVEMFDFTHERDRVSALLATETV